MSHITREKLIQPQKEVMICQMEAGMLGECCTKWVQPNKTRAPSDCSKVQRVAQCSRKRAAAAEDTELWSVLGLAQQIPPGSGSLP